MELLEEVLSNNAEDFFLVTGDFNLPCICWDSDSAIVLKKGSLELQNSATEFLNIINFIGLEQSNTLKNCCNNVLDLILSNFTMDCHNACLPVVAEDRFHPAIEGSSTAFDMENIPITKQWKYQFRKADYASIKSHTHALTPCTNVTLAG
ncbi:hypothetical protein JYU34_010009 [Plutella xylostella]|uniref:Endonuclease/exonuclease/phosphatase domain-containing protein n=1 Tax=Plutella xylostella TaxID=51655 RepID=A0ABQ7QHI0_PLUXY|nr:hypothetical protein JYU34_010009 [Plutella xylostella]